MPGKPPVKRRDPFTPESSGVPDASDFLQEQLKTREQRQAEARRAASRAARPKATYDLPEPITAALKRIAAKHRICVSDLAALALIRFVHDFAEGQVDWQRYKERARTIRFDWNLDLSAELDDLPE